jgi:DNA repair exonuclease SbcCD ATPase subunit
MYELVANPVGAILAAIVVTLKFLYEAFQSSVAGGKELKAAFAAVSAIGTQVKDAIFGLGRALIDVAAAAYKFITLDFKGAAESMKKANKEASESYKQLGNAVDGTTAKIAYNLEKQQQANDKARKLQAVVQSETNKLLVQSREILTDETASIKDKKKALEEVTKAEKASSAEKVRIAAEDLRIAQEKAKMLGGEAEKKAKQELRDLTIALNEAETENAMTGIKLNKQRKMLNRQETADAKEAADAQKEILKAKSEAEKIALKEKQDRRNAEQSLEKKYLDELQNLNAKTDKEKLDLQAQRDLEEINKLKTTANEKANLLALYNEKYATLNQELIDKNNSETDKAAADKKAKDEKNNADEIEAAKKLADAKKALLVQQLEETAKTLNGIADLFGKQTAAGKTAAVAGATIETFLAAQKAYSATVGIPIVGPVLAPINAGLAIAAGFKNIKSILDVQVPGGGGGSVPAMSVPVAPSFNVVGNSGVNQVANVLNNQGMPPIKTYVTAGEVTTQQGLNRNIVSNATLG